jgi:hypothetical protein
VKCKIVAKVLANRLKMVVVKIVYRPQNPFIKGRQILDSVLISNECIDDRPRYEVPGVMCTLDLENAFDHVNWDFRFYMLKRCGFGKRWCKWVAYCISFGRFSIFSSSNGLRLGDLLSPLPFVIGIEVLRKVISALMDGGLLSPREIAAGSFVG